MSGRKVLSFVIISCLIFTMFASFVSVSEAEASDNGMVVIENANFNFVTEIEATKQLIKDKGLENNIKYDENSKTLTLDNAQIKFIHTVVTNELIGFGLLGGSKIVLIGENKIVGSGDTEEIIAISVEDLDTNAISDVTFEGDGSLLLTIENKSNKAIMGVDAYCCTVTIKDCTLTIDNMGVGIFCSDLIEIDNATVDINTTNFPLMIMSSQENEESIGGEIKIVNSDVKLKTIAHPLFRGSVDSYHNELIELNIVDVNFDCKSVKASISVGGTLEDYKAENRDKYYQLETVGIEPKPEPEPEPEPSDVDGYTPALLVLGGVAILALFGGICFFIDDPRAPKL